MAVGGDDRELVGQARDGDVRAFEDLVRRHQGRVYALVRRMVLDAGVAEELTQDVFLKAHRGLGGFQERASFSTWLYRIAVNCVRDYRESRVFHAREIESRLETVSGADEPPATADPGPDEAVSGAQLFALFENSVEGLDPHLKEAFLLRHQENLGYEEMSEILGVTQANAKVRVHRARTQLLERLRQLGYDV